MNKNITKLFNLPVGLCIDTIDKQNQTIIVKCRNPKKYTLCPWCGKKTKKVNQHRARYLKHGKINEQTIVLQLRCRQFVCRNHILPITFMERLSGIDRRRSTDNFRGLAITWLQRNSYNFIGQRFSLSPSTLTKMANDHYKSWRIDWENMALEKIRLGLDEHSFRGRNLCLTLTDVKRRKLLEILRNDQQTTLNKWLENIPNSAKKQIDEVCMDLKAGYRNSVEKFLPQAKITADRFHVEQLANRVVDQIRSVVVANEPRRMNIKEILLKGKENLTKKEKVKLKAVWQKYQNWPVLYEAWFLKEKIREMYRSNNKAEARKILAHILTLLSDSHYSRYFGTFQKTLGGWRDNILNYFDHRTTNGFTEGVHTKIKLMKRVSFGFRNINNYIAKMTLAFIPLCWLLNHHTI